MVMQMKRVEESDADKCRRKGWVVGTRLVGTESAGKYVHTDTIEITAIGVEGILARTVTDKGYGREQGWSLQWRDWEAVPQKVEICDHCGEETTRARWYKERPFCSLECVAYIAGDLSLLGEQDR